MQGGLIMRHNDLHKLTGKALSVLGDLEQYPKGSAKRAKALESAISKMENFADKNPNCLLTFTQAEKFLFKTLQQRKVN